MAPGSTQLTAAERQRALVAHANVMGDKLWVTRPFEMQNICAEIGLQPCLEEIDAALESSGGRIDFARTLSFVRAQKVGFFRPEETDADTVRAFVAVGGEKDKTGSVDAEVLRQACRSFDLSVDVEGLRPDSDDDAAGALDFDNFEELLSPNAGDTCDSTLVLGDAEDAAGELADDEGTGTLPPLPRNALGHDYRLLVERERRQAARAAAAGDANTRAASVAHGSPGRKSFSSPGARRSVAPRGSTGFFSNNPGDAQARLRAKGVPAALYGGDPLLDAAGDGSHAAQQSGGRQKKLRRRKRPPPASSPATLLGEGTHAVGRRGLLVDDPPRLPRHYPQLGIAQQAAGALSPQAKNALGARLPPLRRGPAAAQTGAADADPLECITRRMGAAHRLRGKYDGVPSRVNLTGSLLPPLSPGQLRKGAADAAPSAPSPTA